VAYYIAERLAARYQTLLLPPHKIGGMMFADNYDNFAGGPALHTDSVNNDDDDDGGGCDAGLYNNSPQQGESTRYCLQQLVGGTLALGRSLWYL
jgi:hypothetical protein